MTSAAFFHVRVLQIRAFLAAMSVAASQAHGVSCFGFMAYVCISPSQVSWSHVIYTFDQREKYLLREGGQSRSQNDDYRSSTHVPREEDVRVVGLWSKVTSCETCDYIHPAR